MGPLQPSFRHTTNATKLMACVLISGQRLCHPGRMSKGHGRVERAILEALSMKRGKRGMWHLGTNAATLARYVAAGNAMYSAADPFCYSHYTPTRSELESCDAPCASCASKVLCLRPPGSRVYYECPGKKPTSG